MKLIAYSLLLGFIMFAATAFCAEKRFFAESEEGGRVTDPPGKRQTNTYGTRGLRFPLGRTLDNK
jgi:hypothetical protein